MQPNQRLLLTGRLRGGNRAVSSAWVAARLPPHAPQEKRDPLGVKDLKECEGVA